MDRLLRQPPLLAVGLLVLASCSDNSTPTGPAERDRPIAGAVALAANSWTSKAIMPTGRTALAAAVVNNSLQQPVLYAIGGDDGDGQTLSTVEAYDFASNSWSTKAPLPARLEETNGAGVIGAKIYVSGGRDLDNSSPGSDDGAPRSSLYVFNTVTNGWTRKADMPQPSIAGVTGVIQGKLYVLNASFDRFYRYDPAMDTWSTLAKCPGGHFRGAAAVINGKFYVAGGVRFSAFGPVAIRRLHVYNPVTNSWSEKSRMPHAVSSVAGARLLGQFYVLGGESNNIGRNYVQAYDPVADSWTLKAPLPTPRVGPAASNFLNLNGKQRIVAVGGFGGSPSLRSNDVYTP